MTRKDGHAMTIPWKKRFAVRTTNVLLLLVLCIVSSFLLVLRTAQRHQSHQRNAPQLHDDRPQTSSPKILVMGMPRSGSISIHNFFQCNGMRSAHYCCGNSPKSAFSCGSHPTCGSCVLNNLQNSKPAFADCGRDYKVFSQFDVESSDPYEWFLPQHFALPLLHKDYPSAVWILNRRENALVWADSVLHWYSKSVRIMNSFGMSYHTFSLPIDKAKEFPLMGPQIDVTEQDVEGCFTDAYDKAISKEEHMRRRDDLAVIYNLHLEKIRSFVREHPSHKLVEINVDDENAGQMLAEEFSGLKPNCWDFHSTEYDGDWKDFSLKV